MPSVNDWAAKAARQIVGKGSGAVSEECAAAIIEIAARPMLQLLREFTKSHSPSCDEYGDDGGSGRCTCGAGAFNDRIHVAISGRSPGPATVEPAEARFDLVSYIGSQSDWCPMVALSQDGALVGGFSDGVFKPCLFKSIDAAVLWVKGQPGCNCVVTVAGLVRIQIPC